MNIFKKPRAMRTTLAALACTAAIAGAQATPATMVQELTFDLHRFLDLQSIGTAGFPETKANATSTSVFGFGSFQSVYGTLQAARWEIDTTFSLHFQSDLLSLSTNPNETVSATVFSSASFRTHYPLAGVGGQLFQAHLETEGSCSTTAAAGLCHFENETETRLQSSIDAPDLSAFLTGGLILQNLEIYGELWHLQGEGNFSLQSLADYHALGENFGHLTMRLIYDYDDGVPSNNVPEPGSLALVGLGLATMLRGLGRQWWRQGF
jgi:hypothetical protein